LLFTAFSVFFRANIEFVPDVVGTGLAEGETGQAKPDWPTSADLVFSVSSWRLRAGITSPDVLPGITSDEVGITFVFPEDGGPLTVNVALSFQRLFRLL